MRFLSRHWLAVAIVVVYIFFAYSNDYYPFAGGTGGGTFSLTCF
jgi:hypothetical protein